MLDFLKKPKFPREIMSENKKINERSMLDRLKVGAELLRPFVIKSIIQLGQSNSNNRIPNSRVQEALVKADAYVTAEIPNQSEPFNFVVETKSRSTPEAIRTAAAQAKQFVEKSGIPDVLPLIQVPYLSLERLQQLESENVNGVDLCGNGIIVVPGRLYICRSGHPNQYRDSRPLSNPYRGRSAMVARMLLLQPRWESQLALASAIERQGTSLSLSQVSKAIAALSDDLIVTKSDGALTLNDPMRLLDKLANSWIKSEFDSRQSFRLDHQRQDWSKALSSNEQLKWSITGESSVSKYTTFSQAGPLRIAVNDLSLASSLLNAKSEPIPSFADLELVETQEEGYYFAMVVDDDQRRFANRIQTWLELSAGDARQQEAAQDLRRQIIQEVKNWPTE